MKIPKFARLLSSDFADLEWFPRLAQAINRPFEIFDQALRKNLTFEDNINSQTHTISLDGVYPKKFQWSGKGRPTHLLITKASGNIVSSPFILWEPEGTQIKITDVVGISPTPSNKISLTLIVIGI